MRQLEAHLANQYSSRWSSQDTVNVVWDSINFIFSLQGLKLTLEEIETICETFGLDQPEVRILFAKYDGREKLSIESLAELTRHERYSRLLLPCFIRSCAEFSKSAKKGETLFAKLKKSSGRDDYDMYTRELLGFNRLTSEV